MRGTRRFSQAISEGDGISLLAACSNAGEARVAGSQGAEGVVVRGPVAGVREATELPILWGRHDSLDEAQLAGSDAYLVVVQALEDEDGALEALHARARETGLDVVVEVRDDEELELARERVDPEIFLLSANAADDGDGLEHVLGLLQDVPAGKLAVADLALASASELEELERAGMDAVIVDARAVGLLGGRSADA